MFLIFFINNNNALFLPQDIFILLSYKWSFIIGIIFLGQYSTASNIYSDALLKYCFFYDKK